MAYSIPTCLLLKDLSIDVRDAVGDRMHISDEFTKEGVGHSIWPHPVAFCIPLMIYRFFQTQFNVGQATQLE